MKYLFLILTLSGASFASSSVKEKELFLAKINFEKKAYEFKLAHEKELMKNKKMSSVTDDTLDSDKDLNFLVQNCIEWVYQSSATRAEAAQACRGVYGLECVNFVYQGPATRVQAAAACQFVKNMECVNFVFQGPATREQSAAACQGVQDMECVRFVFQGTATREEAAKSCQGGRRPDPRGPRDC